MDIYLFHMEVVCVGIMVEIVGELWLSKGVFLKVIIVWS